MTDGRGGSITVQPALTSGDFAKHQPPDPFSYRDGLHLLQPSKRLNHNAVSTVLEKAPRVASTDSRERLPHRLHQGLAGSGLDFAQAVLYLGEGFFDGVKVRRVGRQVQQLCSSLLEQCAHPLSLVS